MTRDLYTKLRNRQEELVRKACARVVEDPKADINDDVRRIEVLDKLLKSYRQPLWRKLGVPLAVALICVIVLAVGLLVRIDRIGMRTNVALNATSNTVSLVASRDWSMRDRVGLKNGLLRVERAAIRFSQPSMAFEALTDRQWLEVATGNLILHELSVAAGNTIAIESRGAEEIVVSLEGPKASGEILVNGKVKLGWGGTTDASIQVRKLSLDDLPPETISFLVSRPKGPPAQLEFRPMKPLVWREIEVTALRFGQEFSLVPAQSFFVSTITKGNLLLSEIDRKYDLSSGHGLVLSGLSGRVQELRVDGGINLDFVGSVDRLSVGPRGQEKEVTPTILEYLYRSHSVAFLFAVASFIWGSLWSLRRLISV